MISMIFQTLWQLIGIIVGLGILITIVIPVFAIIYGLFCIKDE